MEIFLKTKLGPYTFNKTAVEKLVLGAISMTLTRQGVLLLKVKDFVMAQDTLCVDGKVDVKKLQSHLKIFSCNAAFGILFCEFECSSKTSHIVSPHYKILVNGKGHYSKQSSKH